MIMIIIIIITINNITDHSDNNKVITTTKKSKITTTTTTTSDNKSDNNIHNHNNGNDFNFLDGLRGKCVDNSHYIPENDLSCYKGNSYLRHRKFVDEIRYEIRHVRDNTDDKDSTVTQASSEVQLI